jgi:glycosyltransferase involved in cell wall biosynthesis
MKIGIFNSSLDNAAEGDTSAATLAEALGSKHRTEIIRVPSSTTAEQLRILCGSALEQVAFRTVAEPPQLATDPNCPGRRYQALRNWSDELTRHYDLFVNFCDRVPIYCSAPRGVMVIRFPYDFIPSLYRAFWLDHLASYRLTLSNSYYTQFWTRMFWEIDCPVVYPPVSYRTARVAKENLIVSAGPFETGCSQKQLELISAFKQLKSQLPEWSLTIIGELGETPASKTYFEAVCDAARDSNVTVLANPSVEEQFEVFNRARIFWLAAGLDEDLELQPEKAIPFSLHLIQAMAAGCVPLATNSGGLPEVLRHGENGFFWDTTSELIERSVLLARDENGRLGLARAARLRAMDFCPERFTESFRRHLKVTFGIRTPFRVNPLRLWKRLMAAARPVA